MRIIDKIDVMNRRNFMGHSVGTAALLAASPLLSQAAYGAVKLRTAPAETLPTLVKMARDIFPHDRLPDSIYEVAVAIIDDQIAGDESRKVTLGKGVADLDAAAEAISGGPYLSIADEAGRVAVLRQMEQSQSPFFQVMRSGLITALYNQEQIWPSFGYEGSSAEKGGYLHHGFDDLDWLSK